MPVSWIHATSRDLHDRRLALSFGAVVLLLMFAVSGVAGYLFTQLYQKEENRLSSMLAIIFADSIGKVSFSGKYHARLFVEEIQSRIPTLAFISVENTEGRILAHSQPAKNDDFALGEDEARLRNLSLINDRVFAADNVRQGQIIKEVVQPYRNTLDNKVVGVVRIGIKMDEVRKEQRATVILITILIIGLTLLAIVGVLLLSRYFGRAHHALIDQLRGVMMHAPLPISITNRLGQLLVCSNETERLFGAHAMGQPLEQFLEGKLSPADIQKLTEANDVIFAGGPPVQQEMEVELYGHTHVWFVSNFAITHDAHDHPSSICTFIHDITESKRAEQERLEHLRFLKIMDKVNRAIQGNNDLHQMMSRVLEIVFTAFDCDRAFLLFPCEPESLTWSVPMEKTNPEYPGVLSSGLEMPMDPNVAETLKILLAVDGPVKFEPGGQFPLPAEIAEQFGIKSFMSMALYPKIGKPWQFGVHQCSFERVWTKDEERLFQEIGRRLEDGLNSLLINRNLQESEARYRMVFENSPVSIWEEDFSGVKTILEDLKSKAVTDLGTYFEQHPESLQQCVESVRVIDVNKATLALHGASCKQELLNGLVKTFTPESFAMFQRELVSLWQGRTAMIDDGVVQTLSGELRNVTVCFSVCPGHEETLSKVIVSLIDITERKRAEQEREKIQVQFLQSQKMESVGRLAGGVAHDFNNMLQVILAYAEMAMNKIDQKQPLFKELQEIHRAAERSANLTRQLLAFARKQVVTPEVLDLNQTVESMLKLLRKLIGEDISLEWKPCSDLWPVKMDPSQLDQILANLCVNSRDAIDGVGNVTIETQNVIFDDTYCADHPGAIPGDFVLLVVGDTGCGMDKGTVEKVFEPFFTTKGIGKGTGLGLATVYGIVKQNNGFINVYSEPGLGTTFGIYLPHYAVEEKQSQEEHSVTPLVRGNETILVVEDELMILDMVTVMLERLGYSVLSASTPREAIRIARESSGTIHLLLTDLIMPEINGRDLAQNLISLNPDLLCLFMSGYTDEVIAQQGVLDKDVAFIQKPFSSQALSVKLRQVLDSKGK